MKGKEVQAQATEFHLQFNEKQKIPVQKQILI